MKNIQEIMWFLIGNVLRVWRNTWTEERERERESRDAIRSETSFTILAFDVLTHFDALYFHCGICLAQVFTASRVTFFRASCRVRMREQTLVISIKGEWKNIALAGRDGAVVCRNKRDDARVYLENVMQISIYLRVLHVFVFAFILKGLQAPRVISR